MPTEIRHEVGRLSLSFVLPHDFLLYEFLRILSVEILVPCVIVCWLVPYNRLSKRGIDSGRMAVSLAESTCFRKLAKPVTIPAKLWLTFKFVQVANLNKSEGDNDVSQGRSTSRDKTADEEGKRRKRSRTTPSAVAAEREPGRGSAKVGGGRWGQGRGSKRKAICPPGGRRGESGCFVPASSAPRWVSLEAARSRRG